MSIEPAKAKLLREADIRDKLPDDVMALIEAAQLDPGAPFEPAAVALLSGLDTSNYERARTLLKGIPGLRIGVLDAKTKPAGGDGKPGHEFTFPETVPSPTPVDDGAALLTEIAEFVRQYVHIDAPSADAVALWTVMTYIHPRLEVAPFLALMSATRRCGKSALRGVLQTLVRKPFTFSGRITEAVLFRLVELHEPTLLLDEIDTYLRDDPHLRGDINGSQERSGAQAVRCVGDDNVPRGFNTWCAKLFAGIGHLPATTADRALIVRMERAPRSARLAPWRERDRDGVDELRGRILRWITDNENAILGALRRQSFPPVLHDRARDAWESLFAIADVAGGDWCAPRGRAWEAGIFIAARGDADGESARETLIGDLHAIFAEHGNPAWLATDTILDKLNAMDSRPWPEWGRSGNKMTARGLAKELRHFGVESRNHQFENGRQLKSYEREALQKSAFDSYAPEGSGNLSVHPSTTLETRHFRESHPSTGKSEWTDTNHGNPHKNREVDGWTDRSPLHPGNGTKPAPKRVSLPSQPTDSATAGEAYRRAKRGE